MKTTHIVLHYTATYEDVDIGAAEVDAWHRERGFRKIGYHRLYRLDGTREQGRAFTEVGAHVGGQNNGKIGLSYVGGLRRGFGANKGFNTMTHPQERHIIEDIRELLRKWPNAIVCGHNDLAATQCPGFDVKAWWAAAQSEPLPVTTPDVHEDTPNLLIRLLRFLGFNM